MVSIPTKRKPDLQYLNQNHWKILHMLADGMPRDEIVEEVGICTATVARCANSDLGKRALAAILAERKRKAASSDATMEV